VSVFLFLFTTFASSGIADAQAGEVKPAKPALAEKAEPAKPAEEVEPAKPAEEAEPAKPLPGAGDKRSRATALFKEANKLASRGQFLDALAKYKAATELYPSYKIDLNIGGTLDNMGRPTEAAIYFEKFLISAVKAPPAIVASARERLATLRGKLARLKVTCLVKGSVVQVDGSDLGKLPLELPIYLKPGKHRVGVHRPGYVATYEQVTLKAGEQRNMSLRMLTMEQNKEYKAYQEQLRSRRTKTILAYSSLGLGAALVLGGGVLYGVGGSQGDDAHERYQTTNSPAELSSASEEIDSAGKLMAVGHVLTGLAVASAAFSIYQFLTRPVVEKPGFMRGDEQPNSPRKAPGTRASVGVSVNGEGGVMTLTGQF